MKKCIPVSVIFILSIVFTSSAFAHYEHFKIPTATITIDGNMDDWNDIEPVYVDDVNDEDPDANYEGTDLYKFYLAKDDTFLYLMMTLYDGAPKADVPTNYSFEANQYRGTGSVGDYSTYVVNFENDRWTVIVSKEGSNEGTSYTSSKYIGIGSNFIEWKVYLSDMGTLDGKFVTIFIHTYGGDCGECPVNDYNHTSIHIIDEDTTTTTPTPTTTKTPIATPLPTPKATPTPTTGIGIIYGTVTDEEGFSFKNVTVSLTGTNGYSKSTKTDEDGYYGFKNLAAGDYTLTYEKDDYQTKTEEISLEEDEVVDLGTIVMEQVEKGSISGYVVDITGDPVESAKLKLKGISTGTSKIEIADADGFFEFADLEADNYLITAKRKRYRSARKTVTIEEGEAKEIEIEMRKTTKRRSISLLMRGK
jgi:hypothetical protein